MSTKSKRRSARRAQHEESANSGPLSGERSTPDRRVAGEIVGALLTAITFGALEPQEDTSTNPATA